MEPPDLAFLMLVCTLFGAIGGAVTAYLYLDLKPKPKE